MSVKKYIEEEKKRLYGHSDITVNYTEEAVISLIEKYSAPNPEWKFKVGDKVYKPKGYAFPSTVVSVFTTTNGNVRVVAEMDDYGLLHIFNENQLDHIKNIKI